jgi:FMN phosphatase YigB (HAD superfamily)
MPSVLHWVQDNNRASVYSFDVFDTVVRRKVHPPGSIIRRLAAQHLSAICLTQGLSISSTQILRLRSEMEERLCRESISLTGDPVYTLDDTITSVVHCLGLEEQVSATDIIAYEVDLIALSTEPMPEVGYVLSDLRMLGKRLIGVSETYLSREQLGMVLGRCGVLKYLDDLYVSSDLGRSKTTGRLYEYVIQQEGTSVVHVGDDYHMDVLIPRRLGIETGWFHSTSEARRKAELAELANGPDKMQYVNAIVRRHEDRRGLNRIGYEILGPALAAFIHYVGEQAKSAGVDAIHFVARDGYGLKKVYDTLRTSMPDPSLPPSRYLCLSRISAKLASLQELTLDDIIAIRDNNTAHCRRMTSLADVLNSYGFTVDEFRGSLEQAGVALERPVDEGLRDSTIARLLELEGFQQMVRRHSADARSLLHAYLAQSGFIGDRTIAVVDANSEGSTQTMLRRAFGSDPDYPAMYEYYFALLRPSTAGDRKDRKLDRARGVMSDWRTAVPGEHRVFALFGLLVELFTHPNHGVTTGYRESGQRVVPMFRATPQESQYKATSGGLQGILDYAHDYAVHAKLHGYTPEELLDDARRHIWRWVVFPPRPDVECLDGLFITVDWPTQANRKLIEQIGITDILGVKRLLKKMKESPWPEATLRLAPTPGLASLFNATGRLQRPQMPRDVGSQRQSKEHVL